MKRLYFSLIGIITFIGFAALAFADPGTTWDQQIKRGRRFRVLSHFGGAAVLGKETGRVWEQSRIRILEPGLLRPITATFDKLEAANGR